MNFRWIIFASIVPMAVLCGCNIDRNGQRQAKETAALVTNPVQTVGVQAASETDLVRNLEVTGEVTTSDDSQVGAKTAGKIVAVYVRDGDHVKSGETLAVQDTRALQAQLNQAEISVLTAQAAVSEAQSQLTQAIRNATINPSRSIAGVLSARAALRGAQANLTKMLAGARPQERRQAQATLDSAKTNMDVQKRELDRITTLVKEGALAGNQVDLQSATYQNAVAAYKNALESMNMIKQGNRQEDIDSAREEVRQAQQALDTAQATRNLDPLYKDQVDSAKAQLESARAQVQNAQAQVVIARQAMDDAIIRAPFDGSVSGKPIQIGTIAVPGTPVLRVIGTQGIYFEGSVPSDYITQIQVGQTVQVSIDALNSRAYGGHIAAISPLGSSVGRLFTVRIQFEGAPPEVRPGMFARGEIQVQKIVNATVVPATAVLSRGETRYVYTVENGKAKKVIVETGLQQGQMIQVKGLPTGAKVIVQGQDRISDGAPVNVTAPVGNVTATGSYGTQQDRGQG